MLTPRMKEALDFITAHVDEHGFSPSFQVVADELGLASKSGVSRLVDALIERGWLTRRPHSPNGLEVIRRIGEPVEATVDTPAQEPAFGWLDPAARRPGVIVVHVNAQGEEQAVHVFPDLASAADGLSRMP